MKTPGPKPHESLNFEQGEVLYENTKVAEWVKFWQMTMMTVGAFGGVFVPYNLGYKTNLVTDAADELSFGLYHLCSPSLIDITRLTVPLAVGVGYYVVYALQNFINCAANDYIIKMSYSKDKELLFVKRIDVWGLVTEEVYEMAHL